MRGTDIVAVEKRPFFSIPEVAGAFGVSQQAVLRWLRTGRVRRFGRTSRKGRYRIPRGEFVRLLRGSGRSVRGVWERRRLRVLVIDGHPMIRRLLEDAGRGILADFQVKSAPNAEDGIVLAAGFLPDIVAVAQAFAAGHLQGDQAVGFIRRAKALRGTRVLALAADPRLGRELLEAGADAFLRKPFGLRELRESLRQLAPRSAPAR